MENHWFSVQVPQDRSIQNKHYEINFSEKNKNDVLTSVKQSGLEDPNAMLYDDGNHFDSDPELAS